MTYQEWEVAALKLQLLDPVLARGLKETRNWIDRGQVRAIFRRRVIAATAALEVPDTKYTLDRLATALRRIESQHKRKTK